MIRKAQVNDIEKINIIGKNLYPNFEKIFNIYNYLDDINYIILVNEDNIINGFMIVYKNIDYYELLVIDVLDDFHSKGIGTNMLNYFFDFYCKKGDIILLEVSNKNSKAMNLYNKFDFETINVRSKYYKDSDAYVMKKVI